MQAFTCLLSSATTRCAATSLIAEQAGVSKGLLWHYFTDKTDLLRQNEPPGRPRPIPGEAGQRLSLSGI
jgi:hypothetical protein